MGEGLTDRLVRALPAPSGLAKQPDTSPELADPGDEAGEGFGETAPVVQPAQLMQAVVFHLARQLVEGVPHKVHPTPLAGGLREHLTDRRVELGAIICDDG